MNLTNILIFLISCYLTETLAWRSLIPQNSRRPPSQRRVQTINRRISNPSLIQKYCAGYGLYPLPRNKFVKRQSSMSDDDGDDSSTSSGDSSSNDDSTSMMTTLKGLLKRVPQINFYSSIPNAVGVVGQGFSVLDKLSVAMGSPLPYYIGSLPIVFFGIALVFIPDLTTLNLPGFYPSGAGEGDPLAAFPPRPNLDDLPDLDLSLSEENFPPRIIPPSSSSTKMPQKETLLDDHRPSSPQNPPSMMQMQDESDADSPTNPESFQAPRRRIGGGGEGVRNNVRIHQVPQQFHRVIHQSPQVPHQPPQVPHQPPQVPHQSPQVPYQSPQVPHQPHQVPHQSHQVPQQFHHNHNYNYSRPVIITSKPM